MCSKRPLEMSEEEVTEKFSDPEEFTNAVVDCHINDLENTGIENASERRNDLFEVIRDMVKDELWED